MFDKLKSLAEKAKLKELAAKAKETISKTAVVMGDLNGDGIVDEADGRIAAKWARDTAKTVSEEAGRLGKEALRSDLAKDAASHAAVGAAIAVPIPIIGPLAGAAIGAGVGLYRNLTKLTGSTTSATQLPAPSVDVHAELLKLQDLREKSVITEDEFSSQKRKLLNSD